MFKLERKIRLKKKKKIVHYNSEFVLLSRATEHVIGKWFHIELREIAHVRNALGRKLEFNPIKKANTMGQEREKRMIEKIGKLFYFVTRF